MVVASIHIYPVKSLAGVGVAEVEAEPWGLRDDRRWLVVNPDGSVLTAREQHRMLGVSAVATKDGGIVLAGLDRSTLRVESPICGETIPIAMSRLNTVRAAGCEADVWLSQQLGSPVRLGWLDDPRRRCVSVDHGGRAGEPLNLSDAGPLLLTTSASLRQLNDWLTNDATKRGEEGPATMVMRRFRPSVVIDGVDVPFAEDSWSQIHIGTVEFRFAEQCDRCVLTTIDPETLVIGKEPLRTLARHRRRDHKTWFGIRVIPVTTGMIRVGDIVTAR